MGIDRLLSGSLRVAPALLLAGSLLATAPVHAQSTGCQFVLGFQVLHDMDAADVGSCLDNQSLAAASGDQQQHTTGGLLVWRKADNWTAFTNGYWTWINGPAGLVQRLNTQRFSWEANPDNLPLADAPATAALSSTVPAPAPASPRPAPAPASTVPAPASSAPAPAPASTSYDYSY
ncbi:MAG TPA: hypothetical protein VFS62_17035 [Chloroflexota bacterium]|jgi:hypothetical protein|nr:hypothetical protein [Chloroflexota bacterium]